MKRLLTAAVAALAGGFVGALIATMATPQRQDAADAYLAANRAEMLTNNFFHKHSKKGLTTTAERSILIPET